jgi:predicted metal-dependent hydrolase
MRKYIITRSNRKTIAIKINKDSSLEVKAPVNLPKDKIDEFVNSKEKWIAKNSERISNNYFLKKQFKLNFGDFILVRGQNSQIKPINGKTAIYNKDKKIFFIPETAKQNQIKKILIELYKKIAHNHINKRVNYFKNKMDVKPIKIGITSAKTRWGSCSGKNSINFSWKLIMADNKTIDYVIIHELAHIKQHNHSKKFWNIVESIMPDYLEQKERLKILGEKLNKENWDN